MVKQGRISRQASRIIGETMFEGLRKPSSSQRDSRIVAGPTLSRATTPARPVRSSSGGATEEPSLGSSVAERT